MTAALGLQIDDAKMRYSQELASGAGGRGEAAEYGRNGRYEREKEG